MSRDLHFSLDNLPERYRAQVARQIGAAFQPKRTENPQRGDGEAAVKSEARRKKPSARSPVRMPKMRTVGPNKTEEAFNRDVLANKGRYEAITLHLPCGVKYTPDWMFEDIGKTVLVECKGSYHLPTHGRSVMAFKIACSEFPQFVFVFAELGKDGKTWKVGRYRGGAEIDTFTGTAEKIRARLADAHEDLPA